MKRDEAASKAADEDARKAQQAIARNAAREARSPAQNAVADLTEGLSARAAELNGCKLPAYSVWYEKCKQVIDAALASPEWTPEDKLALLDVVQKGLPQVENIVDIKKVGKEKLRFRELRGEA